MSDYKGRIKGNSNTESFRPSVLLLSKTEYPVATLFCMWHGSRHNEWYAASDIDYIYHSNDNKLDNITKNICQCYPEYSGSNHDDYKNVIRNIAKMALIADLPPAESVSFNFQVEDANVAWREQLVRSHFSQYWLQTSRTADLRYIDVNMSDSIKEYGGDEAADIYKNTVQEIRNAYTKLSDLGVPIEDIRLAPQGMLHRVYWMTTLRELLKIIPKRISWIAQASLWTPIIEDLIKILGDIDDIFKDLVGTPSGVKIKGNNIISYSYDNENEDRFYNRDPQPVDPLYLAYHKLSMPVHTDTKMYDVMKSYYIKLWSDDILRILGWDRGNPSKLGKYDRP